MSIMITFGVGFFTGIYLYISGFAGLMTQFAVPSQSQVDDFVIIADAYGGCRSECPSFQVKSDGGYRYLYHPEAGAGEVLRQGTLPGEIRRDLRRAVTPRALDAQSESSAPSECVSFADGVDVVYEITVDGTEYVIDSCGTAVDGNSDLWQALNSIWVYYGTL